MTRDTPAPGLTLHTTPPDPLSQVSLWIECPDHRVSVCGPLWCVCVCVRDIHPQCVDPGCTGGLMSVDLVRYTFADPWGRSLSGPLLTAIMRRMRCSPSMAPHLLSLG